jgi:hypothetical protein
MGFQAPVFPLKVIMNTASASATKDGGHIGEPSAQMLARGALLGRTLHPLSDYDCEIDPSSPAMNLASYLILN